MTVQIENTVASTHILLFSTASPVSVGKISDIYSPDYDFFWWEPCQFTPTLIVLESMTEWGNIFYSVENKLQHGRTVLPNSAYLLGLLRYDVRKLYLWFQPSSTPGKSGLLWKVSDLRVVVLDSLDICIIIV